MMIRYMLSTFKTVGNTIIVTIFISHGVPLDSSHSCLEGYWDRTEWDLHRVFVGDNELVKSFQEIDDKATSHV